MRIASLVPSATEMLFALGLGDSVVAVTHECDYPPEAEGLPQLTRSVVPEGLSAAEIDDAVRERNGRGPAPGGRPRVARPGLRRRPLGAANGRPRRGRGRARDAG